jgi:threonine dehydrogenase-like Zn-dependent dehydrogenase
LISQFGGIPVDGKNSEQAMNFILERSADGVDVVFEVAGVKELIPQGVQLLRPGGDYILVGLVHPDSALTITAEQIIRKCISITGVHNYAPWHLEESIAFLQRNQKNFPFDKLVSPPFDLQQLDQAISEAKKQAWMRVAIKPN